MQTTAYSNTSATSMDETELVIQARAGETIGLVEYIYCERIRMMAARLVRQFGDTYGTRLEVDDVQQVGIEHVLRSLDKALAPDVRIPIGWLLHVARLRMLDYCEEQRCPIRVPARMQRPYSSGGRKYPAVRVPRVVSLDAPLVAGEDGTLLDVLVAGEVQR